MIVKNLTTGKEWDDPQLNDIPETIWSNFGYDYYYWNRKDVNLNDIVFINGWFYLAEEELGNQQSLIVGIGYIKSKRINALDACELLENQRELINLCNNKTLDKV